MSRTLRFAAVYVALVAMMVHALVPTGWMPDIAGSGAPIRLCTMDGPARMVMGGQPDKQKPAQGDQHRNDICPFGAAPHFAAPTSVASLAAPTLAVAATRLFVPAARTALRAEFSPQSPRAPPAIV
jgi:hypothetical protein